MSEACRFELKRIVADAAHMVRHPTDFFVLLEIDGRWWPPVRAVMLWGVVAGVIDVLMTLAGLRPGVADLAWNSVLIVVSPIFWLAVWFLLALLFHLLCKLLGGRAPWKASFRAAAALSPFIAVEMLIGPLVILSTPVKIYKLVLAGYAAMGVHGIPRNRTRIAFGILIALVALGAVLSLAA